MKALHYLLDIADLLYPRVCSACGYPLQKTEELICLFCRHKLPRTGFFSASGNPVENLFRGRLEFYQADAWLYFRKKGMSQRLMHELKYKGRKEIGRTLGKWYGAEWLQRNNENLPDLITCVPLHPSKLRKRGYNQSVEIGLGFSESLQVPFNPGIIRRTIHSESQTKKKRFERWENTSISFETNTETEHLPSHIALVDDVITTGATIEACATILYAKGVSKVSVFSLCIAIN